MTKNRIDLNTPIGPVTVVADGDAVTGIYLEGYTPPPAEPRETPVLARARAQLSEYFAGERETFELPLEPEGTAFQRAVWSALSTIPFGQTVSYAAIARQIGRPNAVRAVGAANGANPIAVVIPCHRVIGKDGSLTGYGGGLPRKQWLLAHEGLSGWPARARSAPR